MKRECEKISQLASDQLERKLHFSERLSMKFHFLMCVACRSYNCNILKLHQVLQLKSSHEFESIELPDEKRITIEKEIATWDKTSK